jgi:hypothetical protein
VTADVELLKQLGHFQDNVGTRSWRRTWYLIKHHAMKTEWGSGGTAPRILNICCWWRWAVSFTLRPLKIYHLFVIFVKHCFFLHFITCTFHLSGPLVNSDSELSSETMNPLKHFGRMPIARLVSTQDSITTQENAYTQASSGIRTHDSSVRAVLVHTCLRPQK